jgi:hypothetical protein
VNIPFFIPKTGGDEIIETTTGEWWEGEEHKPSINSSVSLYFGPQIERIVSMVFSICAIVICAWILIYAEFAAGLLIKKNKSKRQMRHSQHR